MSKEVVIHATEKIVVRKKTYLCKRCSICHLVKSVHWLCSWALDRFLWLSPSGRSEKDRTVNLCARVKNMKVCALQWTNFTKKKKNIIREEIINLTQTQTSTLPVTSQLLQPLGLLFLSETLIVGSCALSYINFWKNQLESTILNKNINLM